MSRNFRTDSLRNLFDELNMGRLTTEARGALWTLIAYKDRPMTEETMEVILGPHWVSLLNTIRHFGCGKIHKTEDGAFIFTLSIS